MSEPTAVHSLADHVAQVWKFVVDSIEVIAPVAAVVTAWWYKRMLRRRRERQLLALVAESNAVLLMASKEQLHIMLGMPCMIGEDCGGVIKGFASDPERKPDRQIVGLLHDIQSVYDRMEKATKKPIAPTTTD